MFGRSFTGPIKYKDTLVRWITIPLIVLLSHYLTYNGSDSPGWFIYELISDGIKVWLVWTVIRAVIFFLDRRLPWTGNFLKRLLSQILLTSVVGMLVLTLTQIIDYSLIRSYPLDHYSFDLVVALLFILLVNAIYIILYYQQSLIATNQDLEKIKILQTESNQPLQLLIRLGKKQLAIPFDKIGGFSSNNKTTMLFTGDGHSYPIDGSLDQIEKEPYALHMFRANRQFLTAANMIRSIQAESGGKINLFLDLPQVREPFITVSREKAAAFRRWFIGKQSPVHP